MTMKLLIMHDKPVSQPAEYGMVGSSCGIDNCIDDFTHASRQAGKALNWNDRIEIDLVLVMKRRRELLKMMMRL